MASAIWNQFALLPAIVYVYGNSILNVGDEQWKNLRGKTAVEDAINFIVYDYLVDPIKISDFVSTACEMCNVSGMPVEEEHIPLVSKVTIAIIMHGIQSLPPNLENFEGWFVENVQPKLPALQSGPIVEEPEEQI